MKKIIESFIGKIFKHKYSIPFLILLFGLFSCKEDNFADVTKIIIAPEVIDINKSFEFKLLLINNNTIPLHLTLDEKISKSIQFLPSWYCGKHIQTYNLQSLKIIKNDYYSVDLNPRDTLAFKLNAKLQRHSNGDSLLLVIDNQEVSTVKANPYCSNFYFDFGGMWIPGNGPFADSMEGYSFSTKIKINNQKEKM